MTFKFQHLSLPPNIPQGNGDVLDTVVNRNVRLSDATFTDVISYQSFSTDLIMLLLGIFRPLLKPIQTGSGFEA